PAAVCPPFLSLPAHSAAAPCPRWTDPLAKCRRPELKPSGEREPARRICSSTRCESRVGSAAVGAWVKRQRVPSSSMDLEGEAAAVVVYLTMNRICKMK
ncbi:unnamed protein product, partial [Urochloa humidicola]